MTEQKTTARKSVSRPASKAPAEKAAIAKPVEVAAEMIAEGREAAEGMAAAHRQAAETIVAANKEAVQGLSVASTEIASRGYEKAKAITQNQFEGVFKMNYDMFKTYEEMMAHGKENVDAFVQSSTVMAKGFQDVTAAVTAFAKSSFDQNVAAAQDIFTSKDVHEMANKQAEFVKLGYERAIKETGKLNEVSAKVIEEASAPLTARVNAMVERFGNPLAA